MSTTGVEHEPAGAGKHTSERAAATSLLLRCRVGRRSVAIPIDDVIETMRPLPIEPVPGMPPYVTGVALIRGAAVPVVDVGTLLHDTSEGTRRFVTIRRDDRSIALAVDEVLDIHAVAADDLVELPSLLSDVDDGIISALGHLDQGLLFVLGHARLIPPEAWAALSSNQPSNEPSYEVTSS